MIKTNFILVCNYNTLIGMTEVYLLLGSNLGNRNENLHKALKLIAFRCGTITHKSALYETEAWGMKEQQAFINMAIAIQTNLSPLNLLTALKTIEIEVGRVETVKWGPRVIDIDILLYGTQIVNLPELIIPHPYMQQRRFTLLPLNEIASAYQHPVLNKTIAQLLIDCEDTSAVVKL
jgi:2-amino-4-hydroxy-6-hydroxymethyldihydropteridine diphosphokinase